MDHTERQEDQRLTVDRDSRISVVVSRPAGEDAGEVDLGRVFRNMKTRFRIYAWVILLCVVAGLCLPLLLYQFTKPDLTVSSVVTLKYDLPTLDELGQVVSYDPVADLTAPDGAALDLNQITSSYVLQSALEGLELSYPVTLANLRDNIRIDRILTEDSRRQQEVASRMISDKNAGAYTEVQNIQLTYVNRFVVSLTNGFGDEESRVKHDLTDEELRLVLDRILAAYNDYLVGAYADVKLPDDEISTIDTENLDILECLDLLRTAMQNLYDHCAAMPESVRTYRSWATGSSLEDLMALLDTVRTVNVNYLYSYVDTNSIVRDRDAMITGYQYQLRNAQTSLDRLNENIATNQAILDSYKNDEIYVSMQESDSARSTKTTTDYYNKLILEQAANYDRVAVLETRIAELQTKLDKLNDADAAAAADSTDAAAAELAETIDVCRRLYERIRDHFSEIIESPFFTTYAEHSVAQGQTANFLVSSAKRMAIGAAAGLIIACGLWFVSALAMEFQRDDKAGKEAAAR